MNRPISHSPVRGGQMAGSVSGPSRRAVLLGFGAGLTALTLPAGLARAQSTGTLRYGLSTFPPSLNPWQSTGAAAGTVKLTFMRGLMGYDQNAELVPELAESYEMEGDNVYIFKLRDTKFSNGKPVTAADIKFSLESIIAEGSTAYLKSSLANIDTVEAVDDKTVKVTLKAPSAAFLYILANYNGGMVSAESTEDNWIGCGPFTLAAQEKGVYIEMKRNPDFYDDVGVETLRFAVYADENLRYAALDAGDVDMIEYLPWQHFDATEAAPDLELAAADGPFMFLLFNTAKEGSPLANPKVRQAIGYAIERQDVVDAAFAGRGRPLNGIPNPDGSNFDLSNPDLEWSYDPEKAKALLAEAGYPNGFDCTLLGTSTYGMHQDTASVVQAYLQMIGINATLDLPDWGTRVKKGTEGDYDIAVHGTAGDYNDPDSLFSMLHSGPANYLRSFGFKSETIDRLCEEGRAELDSDKRLAIYQDLTRAFFEDVPMVTLNWRTQAYGVNTKVSGFKCFPGFLVFHSAFALDGTTVA